MTAQALEDLLRDGMDFHVSDRAHPRDPERLAALAAAARKGRAYFVVYHIGPLAAELAELASCRVWMHFSDVSIADEPGAALAIELARAAARSGSKAVVHVERGLALELLEALEKAGAALVFLTPPSDDGSLLRPVDGGRSGGSSRPALSIGWG